MSAPWGDPALSETEATAAICVLIGQTLDIEGVTADEDFFELGGTSLQAAAVIAQIERRLGRQLRLADLYEAPTAATLAARLRAHTADAAGTLSTVALPTPHSSSTTAPVFLVHLIPADLARTLAIRRPVVGLSYGLAAVGDNTGWPPPVGVEALAAHYVEQLRRIRPEGPYHLVGHSNGGIIAWEMARQLGETGTDVGLLCLIDTRPPPGPPRRRVPWRRALHAITATPPQILWLFAQRYALWRLISLADRVDKWLSKSRETPQERWERSDQPSRVGLIDLQRDAYRMTPLPKAQPLLIEALTLTSLLSEPIPVAPAYDSAGLAPAGHTLVQLHADHGSVVRFPLAERVAAAVDDTIRAHETPSDRGDLDGVGVTGPVCPANLQS